MGKFSRQMGAGGGSHAPHKGHEISGDNGILGQRGPVAEHKEARVIRKRARASPLDRQSRSRPGRAG